MTKKSLEQNNKRENKSTNEKILLYGGIALFSTLLLMYLLISIYYNNHFYKNTVVNGVNASNMTDNQVEETINAQIKSYILTLDGRNDLTDLIYGNDINLNSVFDGSLTKLLDNQNGFAWPISIFKHQELAIDTLLEYDESLLKKHFNELVYFDEVNSIEPENAHISSYSDNGFEIIPEAPGSMVREDKLYEVIKESILSLEPSLSIEEEGCYEEATIKSNDPRFKKVLDQMNKIVGAKITYEFGEDIEIVDGIQINKWLLVDDDFQVTLNNEGVKEFVDYIGWKYNSFGRVRTFATSYGEVLQIDGGDYGWWLNRGKEVIDLTELILDGKQVVKEPAYIQTASKYGDDDIGDTYVEVNITAQHMFFYKEGKLIVESDFVSGNLSRNYGTPTGVYPIQYKESDATLTGEDYAAPVKYWMPYNGDIGFHDAAWRKSFGKDIYLKNGSHGCINMPPAAAKKMFEHISRGIAVVVYELEGTENYEIEEKEDKEKVTKKQK